MKLLLDQNMPASLALTLVDIFPVIDHVQQFGMECSSDSDIWLFAAKRNYVIVTKDSDFYYRSQVYTNAPKVVWVRAGNCPTDVLEALLRSKQLEIVSFIGRSDETCMTLVPKSKAL